MKYVVTVDDEGFQKDPSIRVGTSMKAMIEEALANHGLEMFVTVSHPFTLHQIENAINNYCSHAPDSDAVRTTGTCDCDRILQGIVEVIGE